MKIVFAIDMMGQQSEIGLMLKLAIKTCRQNTSHSPFVICGGIDPSFEKWLIANGITYISVDTPMRSAIIDANLNSGYPLQALGNYLRYEACNLIEDDYLMYCDCDTIFLRDFVVTEAPNLIAAVAEDNLEDWSRFNSGVLVFNTMQMRNELAGFYQFASANLERFFPGFDQPALNEYFSNKIERLRPELNWRPYWGANSEAYILHTHGVKPSAALGFLNGSLAVADYKRAQVESLIAGTVKTLRDFFSVGQLLNQSGTTSLAGWEEVCEIVDRLQQDSVVTYARSVRSAREAGYILWREAEMATIESQIREDKFCTFAFRLYGENYVRLVIQTKSILLVVSDPSISDGGGRLPLLSCTCANVDASNSLYNIENNLNILNKITASSDVDLIFGVNGSGMKDRTIEVVIFATSGLSVKRYWSYDGTFTEKCSEKLQPRLM